MTSPLFFDESALWFGESLDEADSLAAATRIGQYLVETYQPSGERCWAGSGGVSSFYRGDAGILFFLVSLYRATGDARVGDIAAQVLQRLAGGLSDPDVGAGWMHGKLGAALVFAHAGRIMGDDRAATLAEQIAEGTEPGVFTNGDVYDGACGGVLVLAHLSLVLERPSLARRACDVFDHLLQTHLEVRPQGLTLAARHEMLVPLTGLGHGASGLAMAAAELYSLCPEPAYRYAALSALAYEEALFDTRAGNWIDGRMHQQFAELEAPARQAAYRLDRFASYSAPAPAHRTAWCSGRAGFLATRARALQVFGRPTPEVDRHLHVDRWFASDPVPYAETMDDFTYCCGAAGLADAYLYAAEVLRCPAYAATARRIGAACVAQRLRTGSWLAHWQVQPGRPYDSLMRGVAGLGYLFLRLAMPNHCGSLLVPVGGWSHPGPRPSLPADPNDARALRLSTRVLDAYFGPTTETLRREGSDPLQAYRRAPEPAPLASADLLRYRDHLQLSTGQGHDASDAVLQADLHHFAFDLQHPGVFDRMCEQQYTLAYLRDDVDLPLTLQRDVCLVAEGERLYVLHVCKGKARKIVLNSEAARVVQRVAARPEPLRRLLEQLAGGSDGNGTGALPLALLQPMIEQLLALNILQPVLPES